MAQTCPFSVNSNANFCTRLSSAGCGYTCANSSSLHVEISNLKAILTFDANVTLASLSITAQASTANIVILPGVTVNVLGDFNITGQTPQERLLSIDGNLIVGGAIDITNSPVVLSGSGTITATEIKSNREINCGDGTCPTANLASISNCTDDGGNYCGSESVLPITLGYFKGALAQQNVELNWQTLSEENFDHFEVQRSVNGAAFEIIGTVKGNGFTSEPHHYAFTDPSPRIGFNYYRLNAVDYDGTSELFQAISVEVKPDFSSVRLYPNPSTGESFTLAIPEGLQGGLFSLAVTDVNGNVLLEQQVVEPTVQASFHSKLAPGIYFVSLETLNYTGTLRLLVNQAPGW